MDSRTTSTHTSAVVNYAHFQYLSSKGVLASKKNMDLRYRKVFILVGLRDSYEITNSNMFLHISQYKYK